LPRPNPGNSKWQYKIAQWMQGRYGIDELTQALMIIGCVFTLLNFLFSSSLLGLLALICFGFGLFRCYSRNFAARARELAKYQQLMEKPKAFYRLNKRRFDNRKTTIYFRCKGCGTILNIPRGKGTLLVTCPKCGTKVEKKS